MKRKIDLAILSDLFDKTLDFLPLLQDLKKFILIQNAQMGVVDDRRITKGSHLADNKIHLLPFREMDGLFPRKLIQP